MTKQEVREQLRKLDAALEHIPEDADILRGFISEEESNFLLMDLCGVCSENKAEQTMHINSDTPGVVWKEVEIGGVLCKSNSRI